MTTEIAVAALLPDAAPAALFAVAVLTLNATPGTDLLLTASRALQGGPHAGLAAAVGIGAGCVVHALAAAFGLAALLALHPQAFRAIQWAGAAYLVWLGLDRLRCRDRSVAAGVPAAASPSRWRDFRTGLLTNLLNPKVALFFLAFLPPFVPATTPSRTVSFLLLGGWFVVQSTLFLSLLAVAVSRLGRPGAWPRAARVANLLAGGLFLALAVKLVWDAPPSPALETVR